MPSAMVLRFYVVCMRRNFSCRKGGYSYIGLKDVVNNYPFYLSKEIKKATDLKKCLGKAEISCDLLGEETLIPFTT